MPNSRASEGQGLDIEQHRDDEPDALPATDQQEAEPRDLAAELDDLTNRYKRALADLDNYRKRSAQEIERRSAASRDQVILGWLEVVDSVERALRSEPPGSPAQEGLRALLDQMDALLARQGVTRIGTAGEPFDPERHEAVGVVGSPEASAPTVIDVARSGFAIGDRVLRPAQVIVARPEEPVP